VGRRAQTKRRGGAGPKGGTPDDPAAPMGYSISPTKQHIKNGESSGRLSCYLGD
jgi:hypothetical protein